MKYLYTTPKPVRKLSAGIKWNSSVSKVLLSFDDGPTERSTERILRTLDDIGVKSMFFCVGNNVVKNPGLVRSILSQGHSIGNHTFNHQDIWLSGRSFIKKEVDSFNNVMKEQFDYDTEFFRPPHGRIDLLTQCRIKKINMKMVLWSLMTADYKNNLETVKFAIDKYIEFNSIVVMHDNIKCADIITDSIKYIADIVDKRGFKFGEPEECLK